MGVVYQAHDRHCQRPCALKLLREDLPPQHYAMLRRGFLREMYIAALLYHPNVVALYECGQLPGGRPFMAMELLSGSDLLSVLQQSPRLPLDRTFEIVEQIGQALHHAHLHRIIHRDIKPANIFLSTPHRLSIPESIPVRAKLLDFGLAVLRHDGQTEDLHDGQVAGTPQYLAPEATWGHSADIDARSDQWALAVVTYRLLTGSLPFDVDDNDSTLQLLLRIRSAPHAPLHHHLPDVPSHIERAVDRALRKHPEQRHDSVRDFVDALLGRTTRDQIFAHLARADAALPSVCPPIGRVNRNPTQRVRPLFSVGRAVALTSLLSLPSDRVAPSASWYPSLAPQAQPRTGLLPAEPIFPGTVHPTPELFVPADAPSEEPPPASSSPPS